MARTVGRNNQRALRRYVDLRDIDQNAAPENRCDADPAIDREETSAAWMPGTKIVWYQRGIANIGMRRNALCLLTPYN
jgi:hypothetical protein